MLGRPVQPHVVPGPRLLDPQFVVEPMDGEPLAGGELHDELGHRAQVDDVRTVPSTSEALDPMSPNRA